MLTTAFQRISLRCLLREAIISEKNHVEPFDIMWTWMKFKAVAETAHILYGYRLLHRWADRHANKWCGEWHSFKKK